MNNQVLYYLKHCTIHEYISILHKYHEVFNCNHQSDEYKNALLQLTDYVETVMNKPGLIL